MVTEAPAAPVVVITCSLCSSSTTATEKSRQRALLTRRDGESLAGLEIQAANIAARDADWEFDHDAPTRDVWYCPTCAAKVAAERKAPCPAWCSDCEGYSFWGQGTQHNRSWLKESGELLAEVAQHVDLDGAIAWTTARLHDVPDDFDSLADLTEHLRVATELLDAIREYGLTLGDVA